MLEVDLQWPALVSSGRGAWAGHSDRREQSSRLAPQDEPRAAAEMEDLRRSKIFVFAESWAPLDGGRGLLCFAQRQHFLIGGKRTGNGPGCNWPTI